MKEITVKIRDDDYEWLISRATELREKYEQATGRQMIFSPEDIVKISLQDRALSTICKGLKAGFARAESLMKKAVRK